MKQHPVLVALAGMSAACSFEAETEPAEIDYGPLATISVTGRSAEDCTTHWNGQALTPVQVRERATEGMMARVEAIGGPQNITDGSIFSVRFEAASDTPWTCARSAMEALAAAGVADLQIRPGDERAIPFTRVALPMEEPAVSAPRPLTIAANGEMKWSGSTIRIQDFEILPTIEGVYESVLVVPDDDAPFRPIYDAATALHQVGLMAVLPGCGAPGAARTPPGGPDLCNQSPTTVPELGNATVNATR